MNHVVSRGRQMVELKTVDGALLPATPPTRRRIFNVSNHAQRRPLTSTPIRCDNLNISDFVNDLLETDPDLNDFSFTHILSACIDLENGPRDAAVAETPGIVATGQTGDDDVMCGRADGDVGSIDCGQEPGLYAMKEIASDMENQNVDTVGCQDSLVDEEVGIVADSAIPEEQVVETTAGIEIDPAIPSAVQRVKKRKLQKENWKRNKAQKLRETGKSYSRPSNNETADARSLGMRCHCSLKHLKCSQFTDENRQDIFDYIWNLSWDEKKVFVITMVEKGEVARKTVPLAETEFKKNISFKHFLNITGGARMQVCRAFFLSTTGLRKWWVRDWTVGEPERVKEPRPISVNRQKHLNDRKFCKEQFFDLLPRLPSHYCRSSSSKLYLESTFQTFSDVYKQYTLKCQENDRSPLCRQVVKDVFDELNLSIFRPRKDQCDTCVGYANGNISEEQWLAHRERKDQAQQAKSRDKDAAVQSQANPEDKTFICTMDLQAVLLAPSLKASALYYKTKLCTHNFTLYNLCSRDAVNYLWHEGEGGLTTNEFATCVVDYLKTNPGYKKYILYSDGCTYQNRNATLAKALAYFATQMETTVEQKILEKGHTQMECDSVHSCIERRLKNAPIYVPADYIDKITSARSVPGPYKVNYVQHSFFKDFNQTSNLQTIRPGRKVGDPTVTDLRCILYQPDGTILYKLSHDENEEYKTLPHGRNQATSLTIVSDPTPLYNGPRKITKDKYKHLQELKSVIPVDYHSFYDGLPVW